MVWPGRGLVLSLEVVMRRWMMLTGALALVVPLQVAEGSVRAAPADTEATVGAGFTDSAVTSVPGLTTIEEIGRAHV